MVDLDKETQQRLRGINIIARRANQISTELKAELNRKFADFSSPTDTMEETFENREQIGDLALLRTASQTGDHRYGGVPRSRGWSTRRARTSVQGDLNPRRWHPETLRPHLWRDAAFCWAYGQHSGLQGCHAVSFIEDGRRRSPRGDDAAGQAVHHAADDGHALEKPHSRGVFDPENGAWNSHVSLGEWADCYLIAPATANTLAKMATGVPTICC